MVPNHREGEWPLGTRWLACVLAEGEWQMMLQSIGVKAKVRDRSDNRMKRKSGGWVHPSRRLFLSQLDLNTDCSHL